MLETPTPTRQLWESAKPKRRMIAVGVALNGGAFAVVSEPSEEQIKAEEADVMELLNYAG